MEDKTAQTKGVCYIDYCCGDMLRLTRSAKFPEFLATAGDLFGTVPFRVTSVHFCYDDPSARFLLSSIRMAFGKAVHLRIRTHYGVFLTCPCYSNPQE
jgi:hypothetical protein